MRLIRYRGDDGVVRFGSLDSEQMIRVVEGDPFGAFRIGHAVGPFEQVQLLAPCQPSKIIGIAVNYRGATGWAEGMQEPLVFMKPGTSACGPQDPICCPFLEAKVWGEVEIAVVVKKRLRNVSPDAARDAILGFTVANDVSAENVEGRDHHLLRSKGADSFCPMGPWIDTAYDPADRLVEAFHNGELIRRGRTSERIWDDARIISWLSSWMTLEAGDVILTGTPPRVTPRRYLCDGDTFSARVEGLGQLTNTFRCLIGVSMNVAVS